VYVVYSFLLTVGFLLLLPRFAIDALRSGKYVTGLRQRLGQIPRIDSSQPVIWLHCVSVGETEAARPLVRELRERLPNHLLVISTTTVTGQQVARRSLAEDAAAIFYFPIDWPWTVRRVLGALNPAAVLVMETELWPNLLRECGRRAIPVVLVNGRISPQSYRRYKWIDGFMRRVLTNLTLALMQTDDDAERLTGIGLDDRHLSIVGNMKFDSAPSSTVDDTLASDLARRFGFDSDQRLIVAASTHPPEEIAVIEAFKNISKANGGARLLIAPRHPERFDEVARLLSESDFLWTRRTAASSPADTESAIVLLDSIGELRAAFQLADIAFVGGSLIPHGGQNVLEPAAQGVCVITGSHTHNFAAITRMLSAQDALIQLPDLSMAEAPRALAEIITQLLSDDSRRQAMGTRARNVCQQNRGATQRTAEIIVKLLETPGSIAEEIVPFTAPHLTAVK
jgi:3-deoxy-D-manno-octulosonic-acid transferase